MRLNPGKNVMSSNSPLTAIPLRTAAAPRPAAVRDRHGPATANRFADQHHCRRQPDDAGVAQDAEGQVVRVGLADRERVVGRRRLARVRHDARPDSGDGVVRPRVDRVAPQVAAVDQRGDRQRARRHEDHGCGDGECQRGEGDQRAGGKAASGARWSRGAATATARRGPPATPIASHAEREPERIVERDAEDEDDRAHPSAGRRVLDRTRHGPRAEQDEWRDGHRSERGGLPGHPDGRKAGGADEDPLETSSHDRAEGHRREAGHWQADDECGPRRPMAEGNQGDRQHQRGRADGGHRAKAHAEVDGQQRREGKGGDECFDAASSGGSRKISAPTCV